MKSSIKLGLVSGSLIGLFGVATSAFMYTSGGYKVDNAHVPLIIGLLGFLVFAGLPLFFLGVGSRLIG